MTDMEDLKERYGRQVSADDGCDTDGAWNFALDSESSENGDRDRILAGDHNAWECWMVLDFSYTCFDS